MLRVTQRNEGPRGRTGFLLEMGKGKEQAGITLEMYSMEGGWEDLEAPDGSQVSWALWVLSKSHV